MSDLFPSMIYTHCNSVELVNPPKLSLDSIPLEYSFGEMLQWYFRALADSCNVKNYQPAFLAVLPGWANPFVGSCVKKCQQAFLAPLPGKA